MMSDQNGIYITKKEASVSAAILIVLALLIFIGGYFHGKQSVIDGFTQKATQESFNDKVDYLLTMQSFAEKNGGSEAIDAELAKVTPVTSSVAPEAVSSEPEVPLLLQNISDALEKDSITAPSVTQIKASKKNKTEQPKIEKKQKHYGVLAGFSKRNGAVALVHRLKKHNIDVEIKQKTSKSASGKTTRHWFQVITKSYDSKQEVQSLVDKILSLEKIKRSDIKIV